MIDLGQYTAEVLGSYAATLALIGLLIFATWRRARAVKRRLSELEDRG